MVASACTTMSYLIVRRLFTCWFAQHNRMCRHILISWSEQRLHTGEIYCLRMCFFTTITCVLPYMNMRRWVSLVYVI